jgi:hypothetical protein
MAIEIRCPNCEKPLKVPETVFGKKIKCKQCDHPFVVPDPTRLIDDEEEAARKKPAVKPSKPGGATVKTKKEEPKKEEPKKEEPKPAESTYKFQDEEDEGANPSPLAMVDEGQDIPRCPHCAKELDPPDARVCVHCGFDNVTRTKAESKTVWEPDTNDWINHLGPGVIALIAFIGMLVLDIVCWVNMRDWLTDTFLQRDDPDAATGEKSFYVKPGAFITLIIAIDLMPMILCARFAIKRLFIENTPSEKVKT